MIDWDVEPPHTPYTVPHPDDPGAFKVALHMSGPPVDADTRSFEPDPDRVGRVVRDAAPRFAPHRATAAPRPASTRTTPDEDFVLDRVRSVVVGSPCSGHGFKFAPLTGRILADLAMARPAPPPIERFLAAPLG